MIPAVTYEELAIEYYDDNLHPTCSNFRDASKSSIQKYLSSIKELKGKILEVGAGKSVAAEILLSQNLQLNNLIISDSSRKMLEYSLLWEKSVHDLIVCSADDLPFKEESISLIISSLGDPYNTGKFWNEVSRTLKKGGICIYTTPSYVWANKYREVDKEYAVFETKDHKKIKVPSLIYPKQIQKEIIERTTLKVVDINEVKLRELKSENISPKLLIEDMDLEILTAYLIRKDK